MKTVRQIMQADAITASPRDNVAFAVTLIQRFHMPGLPVVDFYRLVGTIDAMSLYGLPADRLVGDVMRQTFTVIQPDISLQEALQLMDSAGVSWLPVIEGEQLAGIITKMDILAHLSNPTDPKTDLPTSEALRERCVELLKTGKEPVILFLDIDNFGAFNKRYGHVVGDRVLVGVAQLLVQLVDEERDYVTRFGGDEFAIVTTRPRPESRQLASLIRERIRTLRVEGVDEPIRASIGISGGKRVRVRPNIHFEATVDDLINLASRDSTQEKMQVAGGFAPEMFVEEEREEPSESETVEEVPILTPSPLPGRRPRLLRVTFSRGDGSTRVQVELQYSQATFIGLASGPDLGENSLRLVVEATLDAVRKLIPANWEAIVEGVHRSSPEMLRDMVSTVIVLGHAQDERRLLGACFVKDDPFRAAARATLDAVNRPLSRLLNR